MGEVSLSYFLFHVSRQINMIIAPLTHETFTEAQVKEAVLQLGGLSDSLGLNGANFSVSTAGKMVSDEPSRHPL